MTTWSQIVFKFSFMIRMVQNMMFVSHSPLKKHILSILDKIRHSRYVLITEIQDGGQPPNFQSLNGYNSGVHWSISLKSDESIYALTVDRLLWWNSTRHWWRTIKLKLKADFYSAIKSGDSEVLEMTSWLQPGRQFLRQCVIHAMTAQCFHI